MSRGMSYVRNSGGMSGGVSGVRNSPRHSSRRILPEIFPGLLHLGSIANVTFPDRGMSDVRNSGAMSGEVSGLRNVSGMSGLQSG